MPIAPIVHPKMNSGKELFQMENSECVVRSMPKSDFRHRPASCAEPRTNFREILDSEKMRK